MIKLTSVCMCYEWVQTSYRVVLQRIMVCWKSEKPVIVIFMSRSKFYYYDAVFDRSFGIFVSMTLVNILYRSTCNQHTFVTLYSFTVGIESMLLWHSLVRCPRHYFTCCGQRCIPRTSRYVCTMTGLRVTQLFNDRYFIGFDIMTFLSTTTGTRIWTNAYEHCDVERSH